MKDQSKFIGRTDNNSAGMERRIDPQSHPQIDNAWTTSRAFVERDTVALEKRLARTASRVFGDAFARAEQRFERPALSRRHRESETTL